MPTSEGKAQYADATQKASSFDFKAACLRCRASARCKTSGGASYPSTVLLML